MLRGIPVEVVVAGGQVSAPGLARLHCLLVYKVRVQPRVEHFLQGQSRVVMAHANNRHLTRDGQYCCFVDTVTDNTSTIYNTLANTNTFAYKSYFIEFFDNR